jgi:hypothetical protein
MGKKKQITPMKKNGSIINVEKKKPDTNQKKRIKKLITLFTKPSCPKKGTNKF